MHEPNVPAAGLCWLLVLMPDFHCSLDTALHLMPCGYLNTNFWLILGIMEAGWRMQRTRIVVLERTGSGEILHNIPPHSSTLPKI